MRVTTPEAYGIILTSETKSVMFSKRTHFPAAVLRSPITSYKTSFRMLMRVIPRPNHRGEAHAQVAYPERWQ